MENQISKQQNQQQKNLQQSLKPMLLQTAKEPFDREGWLYELKLDGLRCLAHIDGTTLISRHEKNLSNIFPEVQLHSAVKTSVVLDGELIVLANGVPDFYALRRRSLMKNDFKIKLASKENPVTFVAFDILYLNNENLCDKPLYERKKILSKTVKENDFISISRFIETNGNALFDTAVKNHLEGVIAKRADSIYRPGKRTSDWLKFINPKFPETRKL